MIALALFSTFSYMTSFTILFLGIYMLAFSKIFRLFPKKIGDQKRALQKPKRPAANFFTKKELVTIETGIIMFLGFLSAFITSCFINQPWPGLLRSLYILF
jgi:hypothetical protein